MRFPLHCERVSASPYQNVFCHVIRRVGGHFFYPLAIVKRARVLQAFRECVSLFLLYKVCSSTRDLHWHVVCGIVFFFWLGRPNFRAKNFRRYLCWGVRLVSLSSCAFRGLVLLLFFRKFYRGYVCGRFRITRQDPSLVKGV